MNEKAIARKLRKCRGDQSRKEVAECVGISVSALRMYENAERIPRDEIKVLLARHYGATVQEIFFDDSEIA